MNSGDFEHASNPNATEDFAEVHNYDEPLLQTNHQDPMGNTESTTDMQMSTTSSDAPATTNTHNNLLHDEEDQNEDLIEAHLVEEDEENTIYDGTLELPWWRQRRIKILIYVICILLLLMAALLAAFLGNNTLSSLLFSLAEISTPAPTKSLFPSSSPHISPNVSFFIIYTTL